MSYDGNETARTAEEAVKANIEALPQALLAQYPPADGIYTAARVAVLLAEAAEAGLSLGLDYYKSLISVKLAAGASSSSAEELTGMFSSGPEAIEALEAKLRNEHGGTHRMIQTAVLADWMERCSRPVILELGVLYQRVFEMTAKCLRLHRSGVLPTEVGDALREAAERDLAVV